MVEHFTETRRKRPAKKLSPLLRPPEGETGPGRLLRAQPGWARPAPRRSRSGGRLESDLEPKMALLLFRSSGDKPKASGPALALAATESFWLLPKEHLDSPGS